MATILGPVEPLLSLPDQEVPSVMKLDDNDTHNKQDQELQQCPRSNPPPNPHFVFPARPAPASAPSSYSRASGRRTKSLADSFQLDIATRPATSRPESLSPPLPDFSFNPGAGMPPSPLEHPFLSPPQSPLPPQSPPSPRAIPTRPGGHGHRRGGSEFVGGQIRSGDAITVLSTSPTKSESGLASPPLKPSHPRRGHAHRRSAALSSHDLSMILKPTSPQPRGNSAPSSPVFQDRVPEYSFPNVAEVAPAVDTPVQPVKPEEPALEAVVKEPVAEEVKPPARPVNRARVGFSDTLEFIPRPLSLVSSDTSSTMTARPGHSLSGSISSIISLTSTTSHDRDMAVLSPTPSRNSTDPRPSTAGAILERSMSTADDGMTKVPQRRNSIPLLNTTAANSMMGEDSSSPSKAPKRWSFFGLEPFAASASVTQARRMSSSSSDTTTKQASSSSSSVDQEVASAADTATEEALGNKPGSRKNGKTKKKKVRSWAGSILTKKSKSRHNRKSSKTRFPPASVQDAPASDDDGEAVDEASKDSSAPADQPNVSDLNLENAAVGEPTSETTTEEESPFPMIDLDAALGPFNTPLPRNPEWEAAQRASGLTKRPLHSAARLGGFSGPGMNYQHRRTESAPEMPPFNRAGLPRYSSNSTMADVFEEDEEDDDKSASKSKSGGSSLTTQDGRRSQDGQRPGINIRVTPDTSSSPSLKAFGEFDDDVSMRALSHKGSGLSGVSDDERPPHSMGVRSEYSASSLHDEIIMEESPEARGSGNEFRYPAKAEETDSATPSPRRVFKGKDLAPVDVSPLHLPTPSLAPISPYSISHSSSFPSPRSPMSYEDGNRISTAPSSVTEDTFQSLLMGEPGPEVRISMEIPSLTSSNSTMTRESAFANQMSQPPVRGERPASFSSPFGRRGSLASIGRLISTSHGERSKLSMEISLATEQADGKSKSGKTKRLSRLMQFWKPKSGSSA